MTIAVEAIRQLSMIQEARVWAKLVTKEGDGRSRMLAALNELFPHEEWFERAANVYGRMMDEHDEWQSKDPTGG